MFFFGVPVREGRGKKGRGNKGGMPLNLPVGGGKQLDLVAPILISHFLILHSPTGTPLPPASWARPLLLKLPMPRVSLQCGGGALEVALGSRVLR